MRMGWIKQKSTRERTIHKQRKGRGKKKGGEEPNEGKPEELLRLWKLFEMPCPHHSIKPPNGLSSLLPTASI